MQLEDNNIGLLGNLFCVVLFCLLRQYGGILKGVLTDFEPTVNIYTLCRYVYI